MNSNAIMKLSAVLTILSVFFSCTKESPVYENYGEMSFTARVLDETDSQSPETRTTLSGTAILWSESDKVSVFSSEKKNVCFNLTAGKGTGAGVFSGTITGDGPYYLLYPYISANAMGTMLNMTLPDTQTYAENSFGPGANWMVAKADALGDNVSFKNLCGVLRLQLKGSDKITKLVVTDKAGFDLWGKFMLTIDGTEGTDSQNFRYNSASGIHGNSITLDCGEGVQLSSTPTPFDIVVPKGSFASGLTLDVYNGSVLIASLSTFNNHTVQRAHIHVIKPITITAPEAGDLSATESANCYIIKKAGSYKFKAVKGNSSAAVSPASVETLWESFGSNVTPTVGCIISSPTLDGEYIKFSATGTAGNAVIAAKDDSGNIIWSWHIWVPSTKVTAAKYSNMASGGVMSHNLGALSNGENDPLALGLQYQWGRKDPFPGAYSYASGNIMQKTTATFTTEAASASSTVEYAIAHPTTVIYCTTTQANPSPNDWVWNGNSTNWGASKTIYDPCPPGYQVPPKGLWDGLSHIDGTNGCYMDTAEGGANQWYSFTGWRWNSNGTFHDVSGSAFYWTSGNTVGTDGSNKSPCLYYKPTSVYRPNEYLVHSRSHAVRCYTVNTPIPAKNEKKDIFDKIPSEATVTGFTSNATGYVMNFSSGDSYTIDKTKCALVSVSDDGYWTINGIKSSHPHVALDYYTVGPDGMWRLNGSTTSERATPENTTAGEDDIYVTNVTEGARSVSVNFSDGTSIKYGKTIDWGMYIMKEANTLYIYMGHNSSDNWLRYQFRYRHLSYTGGTKYPDYYDNWGLGVPYTCTKAGNSFTLGKELFLNGEAEAAVQTYDARTNPAKTYSGGVLHGWENMRVIGGDRQIVIKVDGVDVGETETVSLKTASKVEIWQKTWIARAYSPEGEENAYANVNKHWIIENGTVTIEDEYDFLQSIEIFQAKFGMFCVKRLVTAGDTSSGYVTSMAKKDNFPNTVYSVIQDWESGVPASAPLKSRDVSTRRIEEYGDQGISFAMQMDQGTLKSKGGFNIGTNGNNYNKIYFDICGNYTPAVGEKLSSTVHWEIDYISDYDKF